MARTAAHTDVLIAGGGPAGLVLALLFARQGLSVTVLEAAHDFARRFRGDTLHPATLELMETLGLAERLLALSHTRAHAARFIEAGRVTTLADFAGLGGRYPYLAVMGQAQFLGFMYGELQRYPWAKVEFGARVQGLIEAGGQVAGLRYEQSGVPREQRAALTVGADGRFSKVRACSGLVSRAAAPGLDVLWFALPRRPDDPAGSVDLHVTAGHCLVTTDHGERWQVGFSLPKGGYALARQAGLEPIKAAVRRCLPWLADRLSLLTEWQQLHLLSVEVTRLRRWYRPGLLMIGDAAHVISPVGGMGINMAIQDAVATANALTNPLRAGRLRTAHLAAVQRRRAWQIALLQGQQVVEERGVIDVLGQQRTRHVPMLALRLLGRFPRLCRLPGYVTAYGLVPERLRHVQETAPPGD